jgi:replicative DNA helicase
MSDRLSAVEASEPGPDPIAEVEQALLGAILVNNKAIHRVPSILPEHFLFAVHGRVFEHCKRLIDRDATATPALLVPYFEADDGLAEVGGTQYLANLSAAATTIINAKDYGDAIHEAWLRRQLTDIAMDITEAAAAPLLGTTALSFIEEAERALWKLAAHGGGVQATAKAETSFDETVAELDATIALDGALPGAPTGIRELDYATGGLRNGRLTFIAGRPGMGKSALAISLAEAASITRPVLYLSGEMPHVELMQRIIAAHSCVPYEDISRGRVNSAQRATIASHRAAIASLDLTVQPLVNMTAANIAARARRFIRQHPGGIIFVDHIGHVKAENPRANRVHQIEETTGTLKALALDADIPVVALSQLNRGVENRDDKRPSLADLRDSGSIEQDGDLIIFVYREAYYEAQRRPKDAMAAAEHDTDLNALSRTMELLIRKNRSGQSPRDLEVECDLPTNRIGGRASVDAAEGME